MIYPILTFDDVVFGGDKIRIDASRSFSDPNDPITAYELSFDSGVTWINITDKKYLDFLTFTTGIQQVYLRITSVASGSPVLVKNFNVLDSSELFSKDFDLYAYETDIDQYLPKKWSSWNVVHYNAQRYIMDWIDEKGLVNIDREKYTVADLMDVSEVRQWAVFKTLEFIFQSNAKITGDFFSVKSAYYAGQANEKASRCQISLDYNKNGEADKGEKTLLNAVGVVRG